MDTPTQNYSKGVLIQAKKKELTDYWSPSSHDELVEQCNRMLRVTAAAFVFSYTEGGIRCGAATRVTGAKVVTNPTYLCGWTSYRFFLDLFRCPIGDPRITSANVDELPVPFVLQIGLSGNLTFEPGGIDALTRDKVEMAARRVVCATKRCEQDGSQWGMRRFTVAMFAGAD